MSGLSSLSRWPAWSALSIGLGSFWLLPGPGAAAGAGLAATAALASPRLGLLAALATLPLHLPSRQVGALAVSSSELLILAAAGGTGLRLLLRRTERIAPSWPVASTFNWPVALFLASGLLSLLVTEYLRLSLRELRTVVLEPVLAYYLLLAWFPGRAATRPLAAFLIGVASVALAGLAGLAVGVGVNEAEGVRRLQASYPSPNHLGLLLGRALPWLTALAWLGGRWRGPALLAAAPVTLALLATFSLGAWLGTGVALLALVGIVGGRRWLALSGGLALVGGLVATALVQTERIRSHLEPGRGTTFFRLQVWQSALAMIRDHPLLGIGLDNFLYLYQQRYILPSALAEANLSHPHNLVLHFWLQLGLPGLAAMLWLLAGAFATAQRWFSSGTDRLTRALSLGAAASLLDFVVHGLIDNSYFLPDLALVFWLTLAVLATIARQPGDGA